jgi:hypothetical protein
VLPDEREANDLVIVSPEDIPGPVEEGNDE